MNTTLKTMTTKAIFLVSLLFWGTGEMRAQDSITNAFDDLKRAGTVNEQDSEMRRPASATAMQHLLAQCPEAGFYCFTEDRAHDIRLTGAIPARWAERPAETRRQLKGNCRPGEFYTWQIGLFTPFKELKNVTVSFSDLKNGQGERIPASAFQCFNQGGTDTEGKTFRKTLQRARRVLDADGKRRLVDIHSWNHMNQWAGYANSLLLYTELLPYVDRTWIGEGFGADNPADFWLVEMSGIPFGLLSETLDARNPFRGMIFGMLPRLPWSGDPTPLWKLWDEFGMKDASTSGYWDPRCPVRTDNADLPATVYTNGKRALVVIANWTDLPQQAKITVDEEALGFRPTRFTLPEIRNIQWGGTLDNLKQCEIMGRSGLIILLEQAK